MMSFPTNKTGVRVGGRVYRYVNVAFAVFFALVLGVIPCAKKPGATGSTFWDFVVAVS